MTAAGTKLSWKKDKGDKNAKGKARDKADTKADTKAEKADKAEADAVALSNGAPKDLKGKKDKKDKKDKAAAKGGGKAKSDKADEAKDSPGKLKKKPYEKELTSLQRDLVEMQEWVKNSGARVVVVFEGRDAAGKGGAIKRITEYLNPRICRVVALPAPTERQRSQWYFQRYIEHLPAAGEIVLLDRSWYNRAGVERVMGFCTPTEYDRFLRQVPQFENMLIEDGILLRKYWFSVSDAEQERRFKGRMNNPMKRWKLSPMDLQSISRWEDYSRAKDEMFGATDTDNAPWIVVESEEKKRARINMIAHLLSTVPWQQVDKEELKMPSRPPSQGYERPPREQFHEVPDHAADLQNAKNGKDGKNGKKK